MRSRMSRRSIRIRSKRCRSGAGTGARAGKKAEEEQLSSAGGEAAGAG